MEKKDWLYPKVAYYLSYSDLFELRKTLNQFILLRNVACKEWNILLI